MALCVACGTMLDGDVDMCWGHVNNNIGPDWAKSNKAICDWLHRGIVLPRLPEQERDPDFWGDINSPVAGDYTF